MVLAGYGKEVPLEQLREITETDAEGTSLAGIERGAKQLGFETLAAELPYDQLIAGDLLPALLHWDRDHFVVVTEASLDGATVLDPAVGKRNMTRDDFEAHRYGPGRSRAGLLIRPGAAVQQDSPSKPTAVEHDTEAASNAWSPWLLVAAFVYVAALAVSFGVLRTSLVQAVDLQFREGLWAHFGALLAVAAAYGLGAYLVRRQAIASAQQLGEAGVQRIASHVRRQGKNIRRPANPEAITNLLSDTDAIRVWRAYDAPKLVIGGGLILVALVYLFVVDVVWGPVAIAALVLVIGVYTAVARYSRRNSEVARTAQLRQREAMFEYTTASAEHTLGDDDDYLAARLQERSAIAEQSFYTTATEYSSARQLHNFAIVVVLVVLLILGMYRLGYSGLQVSDFTFGVLLLVALFIPVRGLAEVYERYQKLEPSRLRLAELSASSLHTNPTPPVDAQTLVLTWDDRDGEHQELEIPRPCKLAFVGSDIDTRRALVAGMLGRTNTRDAKLFRKGDRGKQADLSQLGRLSVIGNDSLLASGSLAANIAMSQRPDQYAVEAAASLVGLSIDSPPEGLYTVAGFQGEGISPDVALRTLLARAIYKDVDSLVLDGATDQLAAYEEGLLMDRVLPWSDDRLLVLNPARVNAAYGCDLIVHIEAGKVDAVHYSADFESEMGVLKAGGITDDDQSA